MPRKGKRKASAAAAAAATDVSDAGALIRAEKQSSSSVSSVSSPNTQQGDGSKTRRKRNKSKTNDDAFFLRGRTVLLFLLGAGLGVALTTFGLPLLLSLLRAADEIGVEAGAGGGGGGGVAGGAGAGVWGRVLLQPVRWLLPQDAAAREGMLHWLESPLAPQPRKVQTLTLLQGEVGEAGRGGAGGETLGEALLRRTRERPAGEEAQPFLVRGLASGVNLRRWTQEEIVEYGPVVLKGVKTSTLQADEPGVFTYYDYRAPWANDTTPPPGVERRPETLLGEFWEADSGDRMPMYHTMRPTLFEPSLRNTLGVLDRRLRVSSEAPDENMWLGTANVTATAHYDQEHNAFVQLHGKKSWTILSPSAAAFLRLHSVLHPSWRQAKVTQFRNAEHLVHRLRKVDPWLPGPAKVWHVDLEPGDVLYVPPYFLHIVTSTTTSVSANVWSGSEMFQVADRLHRTRLPAELASSWSTAAAAEAAAATSKVGDADADSCARRAKLAAAYAHTTARELWRMAERAEKNLATEQDFVLRFLLELRGRFLQAFTTANDLMQDPLLIPTDTWDAQPLVFGSRADCAHENHNALQCPGGLLAESDQEDVEQSARRAIRHMAPLLARDLAVPRILLLDHLEQVAEAALCVQLVTPCILERFFSACVLEAAASASLTS